MLESSSSVKIGPLKLDSEKKRNMQKLPEQKNA